MVTTTTGVNSGAPARLGGRVGGSTGTATPVARHAGRRRAVPNGGGPLWPRERTAVRLAQLIGGLTLYGVSEALMLAPGVGVDPWDVFHTGLARLTGISVGTVLIAVGLLVLLAWIPLRARPGLGTAANVVVIGGVVDLILGSMPVPHTLWLRGTEFGAGVLLNAVATGLYIGAGLGAGPRDGLTTAIAARGHSIRVVRSTIELSVLAVGWLLGGNVGLGTVAYAVAIGPLVHVTIPLLNFAGRGEDGKQRGGAADDGRDGGARAGSARGDGGDVVSGERGIAGQSPADACAAAAGV